MFLTTEAVIADKPEDPAHTIMPNIDDFGHFIISIELKILSSLWKVGFFDEKTVVLSLGK
ncbi:hypothetical protein [Bacillus sp. DSL-17]|uniref:hypothetical protein n=1 Tax=Metabacillus sediminilitoris TaxID=2567941 RepID=UPI0010A5105E